MTYEKKGNMARYILIGGLVGAVVSLFNKTNRDNARQQASRMKTSSTTFVNTLREDPSKITNDMQELSTNVKTLVNDINEDVKEMMAKVEEIKQNSTKTVQSAREAGDELKEIGGKIRHAGDGIGDGTGNELGEGIDDNSYAAVNTDAHQQM